MKTTTLRARMPTFDFHCDTCNADFTEQLPMGTKTLPVCPTCTTGAVRKIIRPPMVVFKGSGFYKTDSTTSIPTPAEPKTATQTPSEKPAKESSPTVKDATTPAPTTTPTPPKNA